MTEVLISWWRSWRYPAASWIQVRQPFASWLQGVLVLMSRVKHELVFVMITRWCHLPQSSNLIKSSKLCKCIQKFTSFLFTVFLTSGWGASSVSSSVSLADSITFLVTMYLHSVSWNHKMFPVQASKLIALMIFFNHCFTHHHPHKSYPLVSSLFSSSFHPLPSSPWALLV